jgi:PilZ domain-containing protein
MPGFILRKGQRLKTFATVKYHGDKIAGEGIVKDLSLSGSYITGNVPVLVGMVLSLQMFVPGEPELLRIDRATVKWIKRAEFGVDFHDLQQEVTDRITQIIATLVKRQHGTPPEAKG